MADESEGRGDARESKHGQAATEGMRTRRRYRLDEPSSLGADPAKAAADGALVPFAALMLAMQRQEELIEAGRRAAAAIAAADAEKEAEPTLDDWQRLWDDMEREAQAPQRGWEPAHSSVDPVSPEANPEVGEWERHWAQSSPAQERDAQWFAPEVAGRQPMREISRIQLLLRLVSRWRKRRAG